MQKTGTLFMIVSSLIGLGIILSFYGNQLIYEDLIKGEGQIKFGENLIIPVEVDNKKTQSGVYAIQMLVFKEGITTKIIDPLNKEIESKLISKDIFEGRFNITVSGTYKLIIESTDEQEINIFGVIGPEPDAGKKALAYISVYVLIIGLIGIVVITIYVVRNRSKRIS